MTSSTRTSVSKQVLEKSLEKCLKTRWLKIHDIHILGTRSQAAAAVAASGGSNSVLLLHKKHERVIITDIERALHVDTKSLIVALMLISSSCAARVVASHLLQFQNFIFDVRTVNGAQALDLLLSKRIHHRAEGQVGKGSELNNGFWI